MYIFLKYKTGSCLALPVYGFPSITARVLCNKIKKSKVTQIEGQITLQIFPWGRMIIAKLKCIC